MNKEEVISTCLICKWIDLFLKRSITDDNNKVIRVEYPCKENDKGEVKWTGLNNHCAAFKRKAGL